MNVYFTKQQNEIIWKVEIRRVNKKVFRFSETNWGTYKSVEQINKQKSKVNGINQGVI